VGESPWCDERIAGSQDRRPPAAQGRAGPYAPVPCVPPGAGASAPRKATAPRRAEAWRSPLVVALLVVGCLAAPPALAAVYAHTVIMDVDGYVAAVTPVADEPAVRKAVAGVISEQVSGALDAAQTLPGPLPEELDSLADDLAAAPAIDDLTREVTLQAVSSGAFRGLWATANRQTHPVLVDAVESRGGQDADTDPVGLDLAGVTAMVTDLLETSGVTLPDPLPEALTSGRVPLLDSAPLARAGTAILVLDRLYLALPALALVALAGGVLVAADRLRTGAFAGAGLALAMVALAAGLALGRASYLDVTDRSGIPHDASAAIWDVVTGSLRAWTWAVLAAALAVAVASLAVLVAKRRREHRSPRPQQGPPGLAGFTGPPPRR